MSFLPERDRDRYYLSMLGLIESASQCSYEIFGAIVVDRDGNLLSSGANSPPARFPSCKLEPCGALGSEKCLAVGAIESALLGCYARHLIDTVYVSSQPKFAAAKLLLDTPVKRIICARLYPSADDGDRLLRHEKKLYYFDHATKEAKLV